MEVSDQQERKRVATKRDLTGEKFGRYTVLKQADDYIAKKGERYAMWLCECECGKHTVVRGDSLKSGRVKSCGCYSSDNTSERNKKHNCSVRGGRARIYNIWAQMISRCTYANRWDYKHYGGRGIKPCDEWRDFVKFKEWADASGYDDSLTLDRIDPNGGYNPDNCRWVTIREQQNNRRNNHCMTLNGETHSMADWARIVNIPYSTLRSRKNLLGWDDERALTAPVVRN